MLVVVFSEMEIKNCTKARSSSMGEQCNPLNNVFFWFFFSDKISDHIRLSEAWHSKQTTWYAKRFLCSKGSAMYVCINSSGKPRHKTQRKQKEKEKESRGRRFSKTEEHCEFRRAT